MAVTLAEQYRAALTAVQDEVVKLLAREDLPDDVGEKLHLIESICRHGHDVRANDEK